MGSWWLVSRGDCILGGKWLWWANCSFGESEKMGCWTYVRWECGGWKRKVPLGQRTKSQKGSRGAEQAREAGRGRPEQRPRNASAASRLLRERLFSSPHSAPLRAAPAPATTATAAVSAQPGTAEEKTSLGRGSGQREPSGWAGDDSETTAPERTSNFALSSP